MKKGIKNLLHTGAISNIVDLTTVEITEQNPGYLIDGRLLDQLLSKVKKVNLDDLRRQLISEVTESQSKEEIFVRLDEFIYLDKIVNHENLIGEAVTV